MPRPTAFFCQLRQKVQCRLGDPVVPQREVLHVQNAKEAGVLQELNLGPSQGELRSGSVT